MALSIAIMIPKMNCPYKSRVILFHCFYVADELFHDIPSIFFYHTTAAEGGCTILYWEGGKMMSFISKILDAFKMESTREMENTADGFVPDAQTVKDSENETNNVKYNHNDYYARIAKQKENNMEIIYDDVKCYDLRPFDLNKPFISDGHFTAIELEGDNLEKAYKNLQAVHDILMPFKHLFENAIFPNKIGTDYDFGDSKDHLPTSHLRLQSYAATMKENKYPFYLWLSFSGYYGTEYIYMIYFNKDGEIGKADLNLHGSNGARLSYESKIRRNENGLYVMRIKKHCVLSLMEQK